MAANVTKEDIYAFSTGDPAAFNTIYTYYRHKVYLQCREKLQREDAEDVVLETFHALWQNRAKMETSSSIRDFLLIVAHGKTLKQIKKNERALVVSLNYVSVNRDSSRESFDIEEHQMLLSILYAEVQRQVNLLHAQQRMIFTYYLDEVPADEIAKMMCLNRGTIYGHINKIKKKIRASIKRRGIELNDAYLTIRKSGR